MIRYSEASNFKAPSSAKESNLPSEVLSLFSLAAKPVTTPKIRASSDYPEHGYRAAVDFRAQPSMMGMFEAGTA